MKRKVKFKNSKGKKLSGILHLPTAKNQSNPCVLICHGFLASKEFKFIPKLAERLCKEGFTVLRFDFTGNGESEGQLSEGTLTQAVSDLKSALDFVSALTKIDNEKIYVIGHSMGAATGIITASEDTRIKKMISIASPVNVERFEKNYQEIIRKINFRIPTSALAALEKLLITKVAFEMIKDAKKYNILNAAAKLSIPTFIIGAEKDSLVPLSETEQIYRALQTKQKSMMIMPGTKHIFAEESDDKNLSENILPFIASQHKSVQKKHKTTKIKSRLSGRKNQDDLKDKIKIIGKREKCRQKR